MGVGSGLAASEGRDTSPSRHPGEVAHPVGPLTRELEDKATGLIQCRRPPRQVGAPEGAASRLAGRGAGGEGTWGPGGRIQLPSAPGLWRAGQTQVSGALGRPSAVLSREARGDAPERTQLGIAVTRILSPRKKELRSETGAGKQN